MNTTDYTSGQNRDSLHGAHLGKYRLTHWLIDILKNFLSDPVNMKDERVRSLLHMQDGDSAEACGALFRVEPPYTKDTRKACVTPAVMVSAGETQYTLNPLNAGGPSVSGAIGAVGMYTRTVGRSIAATVAVLTESCDGSLLLAGLIEDFLVINALLFKQEGMVHKLTVAGSSAPVRITAGEGGNAKDLFQVSLSLQASGALEWSVDTQGPVFRGLTNNVRTG